MADETYLTPGDIRARLGVSLSTAYKVVSQCERLKFGKSVRVAESAFQSWLAEHTKAPARVAPVQPREPLIRLTRWPDGFDPRPPRKPKPVIGRPRRAKEPVYAERPRIKPTRPRD